MSLPLNIDFQQILLHMLNFAILFGGLYFILYSPVKKFMDQRAEKYKKDSEEAKKCLEEATAAKEEYEKKLAEGEREIEEKKETAKKELEEYALERRKAAEAEAAQIVSDARRRAESEKSEILSSAKKDISEIAVAAAQKVVYKDASEAYEGFFDGIEDYDNGQDN